MGNSNAGLRLPKSKSDCYGMLWPNPCTCGPNPDLCGSNPSFENEISASRGDGRSKLSKAVPTLSLTSKLSWIDGWDWANYPKMFKVQFSEYYIYIYLSRWNMITWQIAWQKYSKVLRQTMINKQHIGVPKFERQAFGVANLGWPCWAP